MTIVIMETQKNINCSSESPPPSPSPWVLRSGQIIPAAWLLVPGQAQLQDNNSLCADFICNFLQNVHFQHKFLRSWQSARGCWLVMRPGHWSGKTLTLALAGLGSALAAGHGGQLTSSRRRSPGSRHVSGVWQCLEYDNQIRHLPNIQASSSGILLTSACRIHISGGDNLSIYYHCILNIIKHRLHAWSAGHQSPWSW